MGVRKESSTGSMAHFMASNPHLLPQRYPSRKTSLVATSNN